MIYTAGIFLFNSNDEILIVHPTNAPIKNWSIPKGIVEENEDLLTTVKRELYEETNIKIDKLNLNHLFIGNNVPYKNKKKTLCPIFYKIDYDLSNVELMCNSFVEIDNRTPFPENNIIQWVKIVDALNVIHPTQVIAYNQYLIDNKK